MGGGDYVLDVKFSGGDYVLVVKFTGGDYVLVVKFMGGILSTYTKMSRGGFVRGGFCPTPYDRLYIVPIKGVECQTWRCDVPEFRLKIVICLSGI